MRLYHTTRALGLCTLVVCISHGPSFLLLHLIAEDKLVVGQLVLEPLIHQQHAAIFVADSLGLPLQRLNARLGRIPLGH